MMFISWMQTLAVFGALRVKYSELELNSYLLLEAY